MVDIVENTPDMFIVILIDTRKFVKSKPTLREI